MLDFQLRPEFFFDDLQNFFSDWFDVIIGEVLLVTLVHEMKRPCVVVFIKECDVDNQIALFGYRFDQISCQRF